MLRIAICDNHFESLSYAKNIVNSWSNRPGDSTVECFSDGDALIESHKKIPFDIILLDVFMPLLNGIDAAKEIRMLDKKVKTVFLASTAEYAVDSYSVKASNYLLKPISAEILWRCLNELLPEIRRNFRSLAIKSADGVHSVDVSLIEYAEAQNKHTLFTLSDGTVIESTSPPRFYDDKLLLKDGFFKCHRSYMVNLFKISSYTSTQVKTISGYRLPIARSMQKAFEIAYCSVLSGTVGDSE